MRITQLILPLIALVLLAACAGTPAIDTSKPIDPRNVMRLVEERNTKVIGLEGYGKISIESPAFSGGGSIAVTLLKPDSLQLEIRAAFGVTVARALVTNRDFQFYDGMKNTVATGETNAQNLRRVLRLSLAFEDILDILTGTFGFSGTPAAVSPTAALDGSSYTLTWTTEDEVQEYVIDLDYLAVQRFTRRDSEGTILEEVSFRDFRKKSGFYLPQVVGITRPGLEESLTLVYDSQTINDFPLEFTFSYPKSARKIAL
ncbi:MAG: hypothetical protein C0600_09815 [Ignavibacteria bacterium]|nr:MAG: hypothetical protein C0600_09815 [Ignavibacteria bacterium]